MDSSFHSETVHTLLALALVSVLSLSGILTFVLGSQLKKALPFLVSAAAGALLGITFAHLLPEAAQKTGAGLQLGVWLTAGFLGSFLLERILSIFFQKENGHSKEDPSNLKSADFHHVHEQNQATGKPLVANILFGGAIHSFIDGVAIATGFAASHKLGLAATIAVLLHEVPHHVADVGVLIYGGLAKVPAVLWNALAGCACLAGGGLVLLLGQHVSHLEAVLLPITAANFLYIAAAILIPELQKEQNRWHSVLQTLFLLGGVALMFGLSQWMKE